MFLQFKLIIRNILRFSRTIFHAREVGRSLRLTVVKKRKKNGPRWNETFSFAGAREPGRKGRRERAGPGLGEGRDGRWTGALEGAVAVEGRLHSRIGTGREPRPESVTRKNGQGKWFFSPQIFHRKISIPFCFLILITLWLSFGSICIMKSFINERVKVVCRWHTSWQFITIRFNLYVPLIVLNSSP